MSRKKNLVVFLCALAAVWALGPELVAAAEIKAAPTVSDSVIVVFHAQTLPSDAADRIKRAGGQIVLALSEVGVAVSKPVSVGSETFLRNLRRDPAILGADYDFVVDLIEPANVMADEVAEPVPAGHAPHPFPFSPLLPADWFYTSTAQQWSVKRVGAQGAGVPGGGAGAWDTTFGLGARIAILDTGVSPIHPDTGPNLVFNASFTTATICDTGSPIDQSGHGTWTASLAAAALGPGTGFLIGVAPQAQILNIKVLRRVPFTGPLPPALNNPFDRCRLGGGSGLFSWVLGGIVLATTQGADVVSMSLGGFVPRSFPGGGGAAIWSAFNRVTNFATSNGVVVVASAGNSALDLDNLFSFVHLPSDSPNVIAVTATTNPALLPPTPPARQPCAAGADCLAFYSNFGSSLHGLAAPGGDLPAGGAPGPTGFVRGACSPGIPGTVPALPPAGSFGCFSFTGASQHAWYVQAIGTSASAPHVAGAAALLKAAKPGLTPAQIRTILQQTAQDIGKVGYDQLFNFGLVNATAAVQ